MKLSIGDAVQYLAMISIAIMLWLTVTALDRAEQPEERWSCTAIDVGTTADSWKMNCRKTP